MKIFLHWIILTLSVFAAAYAIPGVRLSTVTAALIVGACLTFIYLVIKPVLSILTLPINLLTLGLFSLIINGLFLWFLAAFISGFTVSTYTAAFLGALLVSVLNWIGNRVIGD